VTAPDSSGDTREVLPSAQCNDTLGTASLDPSNPT
jgi:hypothetical protein